MQWRVRQDNENLTYFYSVGDRLKFIEVGASREQGYLNTWVKVQEGMYAPLLARFESHEEFGFTHKHGVFMTEMGYSCCLGVSEYHERDVMSRFLRELASFEPQMSEIMAPLKLLLGYQDHMTIHDKIRYKYEHEGLSAGLEEAQLWYHTGYRDALHVLASHCFSMGKMTEGVNILRQISKGDDLGHFRAAMMYVELEKNGH